MIRLLVKSTVRPRSLLAAAACINTAHAQYLTIDVVITSADDSQHMIGSKHYDGDAIDVRSKTFKGRAEKAAFMAGVLRRAGAGWQMILEAEGKANEHFHLEYDPKGVPVARTKAARTTARTAAKPLADATTTQLTEAALKLLDVQSSMALRIAELERRVSQLEQARF